MGIAGYLSQLDKGLRSLFTGIDLRATYSALRVLVRDPSANPPLALFALAVIALLLLVLVVVALILLMPRKRTVVRVRTYVLDPDASGDEDEDDEYVGPATDASDGAGESDEPEEPREPAGGGRRPVLFAVTSPLFIVAVLLLALVSGYVATSSDAFCANTCHGGPVKHETAHTDCVACHEDSGTFAAVPNVLQRTRMAVDRALGRSASGTLAVVDTARCVSCHGDAMVKTVSSRDGVKVSHRELLAAAQPCTVCHATVGHGGAAFSSTMSSCVTCHDGRTASAECTSCHTKEPGATQSASTGPSVGPPKGKLVYPAVNAANRDCAGCHDMAKTCDPCHGIRMPHSQQFKESAHARAAAFGAKATCAKCHKESDCSPCHHGMNITTNKDTGHSAGWETEHRASSWNAGCVCHSGRSTRTAPMCVLCHDPKTHALLPVIQ